MQYAFSYYSALSRNQTPTTLEQINISFKRIYHLCRITVPNTVNLRRKNQ